MSATPDLLIPERDLLVAIGSEADDMRLVAAALAELGGRLEATLNIAVRNAEMSQRVRRDCQCDVDAITDAMTELAGLFEHAACEAEENNALPPERERESTQRR